MFQEARRRLALRYLLVFIVVLLAFSAVFLVALAIVLQPAFDIAPEVDNTHQAREAYRHAIERIPQPRELPIPFAGHAILR